MNNMQQNIATSEKINSSIADVTPLVTQGVTKSGIKYFVMPASKPSGTVELELIVNVGSMNEADSEQGFAHFIEHLGFKSTKNFPNYEIVKELENIGCQYGPDVNASTHLLETKFRLSLVSSDSDVDRLSNLKKGIFILGEWAFGMQISERDVDEERHVILAEYRAKHGLSRRMLNNYWPQVFTEKSRISHRMPIGVPDIFMNVKHTELRAFYKKYYTPANMSVLVSGDFGDKIGEIEDYICKTLDDAAMMAEVSEPFVDPPLLDIRPHLPKHSQDVMIALCDKEIYAPSICYEFCLPIDISVNQSTQNEVCSKLVNSLINYRMQKLLHGVGNNPFIRKQLPEDGAASSNSSVQGLPTLSIDDISISLNEKELVRGLRLFGITVRMHKINAGTSEEVCNDTILAITSAIMYELSRIKSFGFSTFELERAKSKWSDRFMEIIRESEKGVSVSSTVATLEKHILSHGAYPILDTLQNAKEMLELSESMPTELINAYLQLIDLFTSEEMSDVYYKPSIESGARFGILGDCFRVLTCQLPTMGIDNNSLRSMTERARRLVGEQTVHPWPTESKVLTSSDVIGAAQCLLYSDILSQYKSEAKIRSYSVNDSNFATFSCCSKCSELKNKGGDIDPMAYCLSCSPTTKSSEASPSSPLSTSTPVVDPKVVHLEAVDTHYVILRNGIRVALKYFPVEWSNKIALQGFCLRGTSDMSSAESYFISILDDLTRSSGFLLNKAGLDDDDIAINLPGNDIKDIEAQNNTSISIQKHNHHRGVGGSCPKDRLELLLSMLCLKFSKAQNFNEKELNDLKSSIKQAVELDKSSPYVPFLDRAQELACGEAYVRNQAFDEEQFDAITVDDARRIYEKEFVDDIGKFTFTFVGDMPPLENMVQLLNSYIGRLEVPNRTEPLEANTSSAAQPSRPFKVLPIEHRQSRVKETMTFESDNDKSSAMIAFSLQVPREDRADLEFSLKVDFCCRLVQTRLLETLRIKLGKVYYVTCEKSRNSLSPNMLITIGFHCSVNDVDELMLIIEHELGRLRTEGPSESEYKSVLEIMTKNHVQALSNPSYWIFWILDSFKTFCVESWGNDDVSMEDTAKFVTTAIVSKTADRCGILSSFDHATVVEGINQFFDINRATMVDLRPIVKVEPEPSQVNILTSSIASAIDAKS